jgi:hypothetical protein
LQRADTVILAADAHVHLYPRQDFCTALDAAARNLAALAPQAAPNERALMLMLAERCECHAFAQMASGRLVASGWNVTRLPEPEALRLESRDTTLYVLAGRQVATAERIEVLALFTDAAIEDGRPLAQSLDAVRLAHGLPALAYSPGKWSGRRAARVQGLIDSSPSDALLMIDSALRMGWRVPRLMRRARSRGLTVIAGTDPLPLAGEERRIGRYGFVLQGEFDRERPIASLRRTLASSPARTLIAGRRLSSPAAFIRLLRLRLAR